MNKYNHLNLIMVNFVDMLNTFSNC